MLYRLKRHPWPVTAHFDECLVLAYAVPEDALLALLPPGLELDVYAPGGGAERFGFLAIALVQTRRLRPTFLPRAFGRDFFLSGYRVFTKYRCADGHKRRGLRILRSDTDRRLMKWAGNCLTHYNYRLACVETGRDDEELVVRTHTPGAEADLHVVADLTSRPAPLPEGSPFSSMHDARRFAGPLPWTFDYERETNSIVRIHGTRPHWHPEPVTVDVRENTYLDTSGLRAAGARLASAFHVSDIDYRWEPGIREVLPMESTA